MTRRSRLALITRSISWRAARCSRRERACSWARARSVMSSPELSAAMMRPSSSRISDVVPDDEPLGAVAGQDGVLEGLQRGRSRPP